MFDLNYLVKSGGYIALSLIVFAESGLFFGFFLPGDSLLFTAGFLSSQGFLNIWLLLPLLFVSAVIGDNVGYTFGKKLGPKIFTKEDSLVFHKDHLFKAKSFFEKHGGKSIILARFVPVVRTFTPILAGVGNMNYKVFLAYNLIGGFLWAVGLTLLGYFLGSAFPQVEKYLLLIIGFIVLASIMPGVLQILKDAKTRDRIWKFIKRD